jgi:hypothetical protein
VAQAGGNEKCKIENAKLQMANVKRVALGISFCIFNSRFAFFISFDPLVSPSATRTKKARD